MKKSFSIISLADENLSKIVGGRLTDEEMAEFYPDLKKEDFFYKNMRRNSFIAVCSGCGKKHVRSTMAKGSKFSGKPGSLKLYCTDCVPKTHDYKPKTFYEL